MTDIITSVCLVQEQQQRHAQPATGGIEHTKLLCNLVAFHATCQSFRLKYVLKVLIPTMQHDQVLAMSHKQHEK